MTATELLEYYSDTLPKEYLEQPNAVATIQALAYLGLLPQDGGLVYDLDGNVVTDVDGSPVTVYNIDDRPILPLAIIPAFDINTAVGEQLRFIAEGTGAKSSGYNLSGQFVELSDDEFRLLLKAVSARNYMRATTQAITSFIFQFFPDILRVKDNLSMHMSYLYLVPLGSLPWVELFITQGFLPRPLGVASVLIYGFPTDSVFFGLRTYLTGPPSWIRPACTYSAPVASTRPVLLYSDILEV